MRESVVSAANYSKTCRSRRSSGIPSAWAGKSRKHLAAGRLGVKANGFDYAALKSHPFFKGIDWTALLEGTIEPPYKPELENPEDVSYFEEFSDDDERQAQFVARCAEPTLALKQCVESEMSDRLRYGGKRTSLRA